MNAHHQSEMIEILTSTRICEPTRCVMYDRIEYGTFVLQLLGCCIDPIIGGEIGLYTESSQISQLLDLWSWTPIRDHN